MAKPVTVPPLGPSIEEALFVEWLAAEGDYIRRGEPLFRLETDKTITDCESVDEGYLVDIAAAEGATVRVNQTLAMLAATAPAKTVPTQMVPAKLAEMTSIAADAPPPPRADDRLRISPRARMLAREAGVPIDRLSGSGPEGRIVRRDIATFMAGVVGDSPSRDTVVARSGGTRNVPLTPMRRAIARRMSESAQSIPVFQVTMKIAADNLNALRAQLASTGALEASINDAIIKACALALARHPEINAGFHEDCARLYDDIDVAVAVALDEGLITPIVRNADRKSLAAIAAEVRALVQKAKAGQLAVEEYQGGSFTISNLGMYGVDEFTAIINPPQGAILAVGAIDRELYLDAGVARERAIMKVTLSADHRIIDGAQAARFLGTLKRFLENPASLLV